MPVATFRCLVAAALATVLVPARAASAEEAKVLRVYNWPDYVGEDTIARFERESGIRVVYETFDSNEILNTKLMARRSGYDVVVPSSTFAKQQAAAGLLRPLDKSLLPNLRNLDPAFMEQLAHLDPGNRYLVPWLWGYTTLGINVAKVKRALGPMPMPANVWDLLFEPAYVSRLGSCGVSVVDSPTEVIPLALQYLGKSPYSTNPADYAGVSKLLAAIRPHVTQFSAADYIDDLAAGSLCLAMGYSGDLNIARRRALERKTGQDVRVLVPGAAILFVDAMAIPMDAPHPKNAHRFIDFVLRPEVHAGLTNAVFYANPNVASLPFVDPEVARERTVFLPEEDLRRMVAPDAITNETRRIMTRLFTAFRSAR